MHKMRLDALYITIITLLHLVITYKLAISQFEGFARILSANLAAPSMTPFGKDDAVVEMYLFILSISSISSQVCTFPLATLSSTETPDCLSMSQNFCTSPQNRS